MVKRYSKYVGIRTNNQAEYEALISALKAAHELDGREVSCYLDSELVVKHLNGEYKVRNPKLKTLWLKVRELEQGFRRLSFMCVPRTDSHLQTVDRLANVAVDRAINRL